ncbi:MAG: hypothetical protein GY861_03965 [bacterium]|nr:hypothetical protein [bacterium]
MQWEEIETNLERAKVPGGWLVRTYTDVFHLDNGMSSGGEGWDWRVAMTFVPDANHEWVISEEVE